MSGKEETGVITVHNLKTWPEPFQALWEGRKCAEFRKDDRDYAVGDTLVLREYDPEFGNYSGREIVATVTDVRRGGAFGIPEGYAILSIFPVGATLDGEGDA